MTESSVLSISQILKDDLSVILTQILQVSTHYLSEYTISDLILGVHDIINSTHKYYIYIGLEKLKQPLRSISIDLHS